MRITEFVGAFVLAATTWAGIAGANGPAGEVMMLTGKGSAADGAGNVRLLAKGQSVNGGEVISTGLNSFLNLRFRDGSYILLRPNSRFQVESFVYDGPTVTASLKDEKKPAESSSVEVPPAASEPVTETPAAAPAGSRAFFRLLRGGFRAVSGLIGKGDRNEYRVASPVATIGIRGTDYETFLCDASCQSDPVIRDALAGIQVGRITPKLLNAAFARAAIKSGRLVKTEAGDPPPVQVTRTYSGQVTSTPNNSNTPTNIPAGRTGVSTPNGTNVTKQKPASLGSTPNPTSAACN